MKKIILLLALFIVSKASFSQNGTPLYPVTQNIGSTSTLIDVKGGQRIGGAFVLGHFVDTTAANAVPYVKNYANGLITTDTNLLWIRSYNAQRWYFVPNTGNTPTGDTLYWKIDGNYLLPLSSFLLASIGSRDSVGLYFKTNNTRRLFLPPNGINRSASAANKYLMIDTITKFMYYGDGGGGSTPTLQQTLTAGSTLTTDNFININSTFFGLYNGAKAFIEIDPTANLEYGEYGARNGATSNYASLLSTVSNVDAQNVIRTSSQYGYGRINMDVNSSFNKIELQVVGADDKLSEIDIDGDSIRILPPLGILNIDSLRSATDTTTRKPMVWSPATGRWEYLTYWPGGGSSTRFGYSTEDFSAAENRSFNLHDTYNFTYDSANTFTINRDGNLRFRVNSTITGIYSPNANTYVTVGNSGQIILRGLTNETNQDVLLGRSSATNGLVGYNTITSPLVLSGGALSCPTCFTGSVTPAALTKTDDTNVTLTLGGTPTTALLQATSITAGWTGTLGISRGGTGAATTSQNFAFIGPTSGSGAPSFRALVAGDIPSLSSTYLPLAGGTMVGNILATDNTYDLGASGATRFRTAYLATSLVAPLHIGGSATGQTLTFKTTTGVGSGDSILFKGGNNGATTFASIQAAGLNLLDNSYLKIGGSNILHFNTGSNNATFAGAYNFLFNNGGNVFMNSANTTYFSTSTGDLYFSGSGKLGIGTATPGGPLHVKANAGAIDALFVDGTTGNVGVGTASPTSTLQNNGSFAGKYTATATSMTLGSAHYVVRVTATGQTITLPDAAGIEGRIYTIKLTASGSCTVATTSSQTIDASTTYSLASQYKYVTVQSDNANWIVIGNN